MIDSYLTVIVGSLLAEFSIPVLHWMALQVRHLSFAARLQALVSCPPSTLLDVSPADFLGQLPRHLHHQPPTDDQIVRSRDLLPGQRGAELPFT